MSEYLACFFNKRNHNDRHDLFQAVAIVVALALAGEGTDLGFFNSSLHLGMITTFVAFHATFVSTAFFTGNHDHIRSAVLSMAEF